MRILLVMFLSVFITQGCSNGSDDDNPEPKQGCQKASETCKNGGTCNNDGSCDCPEGYSGEYCENEQTPNSIKIKSIKVTEWPFYTSDGEEWDYWSCCPEMYVEVVNSADETKVSVNHKDDANQGKSYTYYSDLPYTVTDVQKEYSLELWDYDESSADDFMGGVRGTLYNEGDGFPSPIIFQAGGIKYEMNVEYNF